MTQLMHFVVSGDLRLMRRLNRWNAPRWIRLWMICATRGGDGWLWYGLGVALLLLGGHKGRVAAAAMSLAGAISISGFLWMKRVIRRPRPCHMEPHCWAKLLPPDQFSFPSGHTMTAFAVSFPVMMLFPHLAVAVYFAAASIAISRIVLGMHFLSDVLAGAVVGTAVGYATLHFFALRILA
jgi:undecaprenyl-diphosphatase